MQGLLHDQDALDLAEKAKGNDKELDSLEQWHANADQRKMQGFYVDWKDEKWHTPRDASEIEYIQERDRSLFILRRLQHVIQNTTLNELENTLNEYHS